MTDQPFGEGFDNLDYLIQMADEQMDLDQEAFLKEEIRGNQKRSNLNARVVGYEAGKGWIVADQKNGIFKNTTKLFIGGAYTGKPVQLENKTGVPLMDARDLESPQRQDITITGTPGEELEEEKKFLVKVVYRYQGIGM